jgi:hypothetical protein
MSRKWTLLTLILSLCSSGTLQANPLDSPGTVYIDGLPCNRACQSYMAWSARALSARLREERETNGAVPAEAEIKRIEHAARPRLARQPVPVPRPVPRAGMAASNTKGSNSKMIAAPKLDSSDRPVPGQGAAISALQPTERPKPEVKSEAAASPPAKSEIAAPPAKPEIAALPAAAGNAPALGPRTIQQQVTEATGMADRVTKTASGSPGNPDNLVALLLARPEIRSLSDLNNKSIAIEEKQSASSGSVSAALMAAGAAEVQFSEGQAGAIDRLISGEVPAAVLTLASPEAAEWFPDIAGFRVFRVPLAAKARL